jgi:serine protease Do
MSTAISQPIPSPLPRARRLLAAALAALALAGGGLLAAPSAAHGGEERAAVHSFAPVVKQVAPSVVTISTSAQARHAHLRLPEGLPPGFPGIPGFGPDDDQPSIAKGQGSGVIVSSDGYVLTNNHVVNGADDIQVQLAGNGRYPAKVVGTDAKSDLAVLKIEAGRPLPAITFGDSDKLEVGDVVLAIGNPFGVGQTVTGGIVSARGRGVGLAAYEDFIQTDASINPGNSGGALVDADGRLVGINTAILSPSGGNLGIGFAVPVNMARGVMNSLITTGKVVRGYLGVMVQPVSGDLAKAFKLPNEEGALVGEVSEGSPAAKAGIKAGDVVVGFNAAKVGDPRQLRLLAAAATPGSTATLTVLRDGQEKKLEVAMGELPGEAGGDAKDVSAKAGAKGRLGVRLADLDDELRARLELPKQVQGAAVVEVVPGSRAQEAGLRPGEVIVEADRKAMASAKEVSAAVAAAEGDLVLRVWSKDGMRYVVVKLGKAADEERKGEGKERRKR